MKHVRDQVSQTEIPKILQSTFTNYPCFYCEEEITSYKNLQKHRHECPQFGIFEEEVANPQYLENTEFTCHESFLSDFQCSDCGSNHTSRMALEWHKTATHGPFATIQKEIYPEESCDFCSKKCRTLEELRDHIRSQHREILPS